MDLILMIQFLFELKVRASQFAKKKWLEKLLKKI